MARTSTSAIVTLDPQTGAIGRVLYDPHSGAPASDGTAKAFNGGLALSRDGTTLYFEAVGGKVERVAVAGGQTPVTVAVGSSPALSPDGTQLAYATKSHHDGDWIDQIAVLTLATGASRTVVVAPPLSQPHYIGVGNLGWAPDNRHLVATVGGEGYRASGLEIYDTTVQTVAREPGEHEYRGASSASAWWAPSYLPDGSLLVGQSTYANRTDNPSTERLVVIDPATATVRRVVATAAFGSLGSTSVDATGRHILYVSQLPPALGKDPSSQPEHLMVSDDGAPPVQLATGIDYAVW